MKNINIVRVWTGLVLMANIAMAQSNWVSSGVPGSPVLPPDAIVGGSHPWGLIRGDQAPLYVCRGGNTEGYGLQLGWFAPGSRFSGGSGGCVIGYGGRGIIVQDFEFLVPSWQNAQESYYPQIIPSNAVVAGWDTPAPGDLFGPPLFYCKNDAGYGIHYQEDPRFGFQPGKVKTDSCGCLIPYGGIEVTAEAAYYVLVALNPAMPLTLAGASGGYVPRDTIRAGTDNDGSPLYICVATIGGGTAPGKLTSSFGACDVGYGGAEHFISTYSVLEPSWLSSTAPAGLDFPVGLDSDFTPLHVCRAYYNGAIYPGKFRTDWKTCHFGLGGVEQQSNSYDILSSPRRLL